jgi:two-component system cell cycle sensor histidine kinase/response regulator CckA
MSDIEPNRPIPAESGSILVVDDEPLVLKMFSTILRTRGYSVVDATSGGEALSKFDANSSEIRLLVTDIVMPHMNGIELATEVKRRAPHLKVLYVSGYALSTLASEGFPVERIDVFLQKPFTPTILASRVQELFG